ncbi:hypothetical protein JTE90_000678 [Oedothorax gibbosus]|uniref:Uncharacterized protein n=1 Tax=Oedothorax gibbosus TaxID=931172 RepID=A0AAV6TPP0_9ARAC|nr:hypothetical protein JTE90_000678 [Oedothorax gibbosus]
MAQFNFVAELSTQEIIEKATANGSRNFVIFLENKSGARIRYKKLVLDKPTFAKALTGERQKGIDIQGEIHKAIDKAIEPLILQLDKVIKKLAETQLKTFECLADLSRQVGSLATQGALQQPSAKILTLLIQKVELLPKQTTQQQKIVESLKPLQNTGAVNTTLAAKTHLPNTKNAPSLRKERDDPAPAETENKKAKLNCNPLKLPQTTPSIHEPSDEPSAMETNQRHDAGTDTAKIFCHKYATQPITFST